MENISELIKFLAEGGHAAIIGLLVVIISGLLYDRRSILKSLTSSNKQLIDTKDHNDIAIKEIVERYHEGSLGIVQALNEIKLVLVTIQTISNR